MGSIVVRLNTAAAGSFIQGDPHGIGHDVPVQDDFPLTIASGEAAGSDSKPSAEGTAGGRRQPLNIFIEIKAEDNAKER